MKMMHLSDLHLGKRVNEFSMLEDQRHVLSQILDLCRQRSPDAVCIAGDIYDRAVPSGEAVELFDDFLSGLAEQKAEVFIIGGNHDSAERLGYGGRIFIKNRIHIRSQPARSLAPVDLSDEFGKVHIYLLPFFRPVEVQALFPDRPIVSYEDALNAVLLETPIQTSERNVLVAHQFFVAPDAEPLRADSETASVGGVDQIDAGLVEAFDYVALGHLHGPQKVGRMTVRYSGSPLKYSFSEIHQTKGVTWVELKEKGIVNIEIIQLTPLHDMREIRGPIAALADAAGLAKCDDYIRAILTDEDEIMDAMGQLRAVYPNIMRMEYDNSRTKADWASAWAPVVQQSDLDLFRAFYFEQNQRALSEEKEKLVKEIFGLLRGEENA